MRFPRPRSKQPWPQAIGPYQRIRGAVIMNIQGAKPNTRPEDPRVGGRPTVVFGWQSLGAPGHLVAEPLFPPRPVGLKALIG